MVKPLDIEDFEKFAVDFINRLRRVCHAGEFKPSIRHSVAMARLLRAMKMRRGKLTQEDYVRAALAIVPPEAKDIALDVIQEMLGMGRDQLLQWKGLPFFPLLPLYLPLPVGAGSESLNERSRRVLSKIIAGNPSALKEFRKLAAESPTDAAKVFARLEKADIKNLEDYASSLSASIHTLEDFYNVFSISRILPTSVSRILEHAYNHYPLDKAYRIADKIDRIADSNMRELVIKHYWEKVKGGGRVPSVREVAASPVPIAEWKQLLEKALEKELKKIMSAPSPIKSLIQLAKELKGYSELCQDTWCAKTLWDASKQVAKIVKEMIKQGEPQKQYQIEQELIREGLETSLRHRIYYKIKKRLTEDQRISELAKKHYEEVFNELLKEKINIEKLLQKAAELNNKEAIAAMSHTNLSATLNAAKKLGLLDRVIDSLTAGPGENLLKEWFRSRRRINPSLRRIVKQYVKEVLLDVSRDYAVSKFGGLEGGPLPSYMLKPYEPGEDPTLVDPEESLENILSQGKLPRHLRYEDLLMREEERGKIALILLNDISGSMAGEKLFYTSVCSLMLLYAFRKEDIGVAFFESDTYKVKDIDDNMTTEDIAEELLDLSAYGGTCVSRALLWAEEQFTKSRAKTKVLVLLSDCAFYDYEEAITLIMRLKRMGVKIFIVAPKWSYEESVVRALDDLGAKIIYINDLNELPDVLTMITNSL